MRIGLDARSLTMPRLRGTGRNLLDAYRLIPALRPEWEFVLYHQRPAEAGRRPTAGTEPGRYVATDTGRNDGDPPWHRPNVRRRQLDLPGDRLGAWLHVALPTAATLDRIDLLHLPANDAPWWCPVPYVATIHDLVPLRLRGELSPAATQAFRRGVRRAVRGAAHLITVSAATRDELRDEFGVPAEKITVIPWAADQHIAARARQPLSDRQRCALQMRYGLGPRWLIQFAGANRRKNARGALDGFARVAPERRQGLQIVLVGCEPASYRRELGVDAERFGIADQCRILGFVPHDDLPDLLRGSCGLLMPSRGEGFGLPILDAFACGVPVLTSNTSAMPEVAGDAAVYCDPNDGESIGRGIAALLDKARAAELVARGRARLAQFSWSRTAEAMCAVYERAAASRRPAWPVRAWNVARGPRPVRSPAATRGGTGVPACVPTVGAAPLQSALGPVITTEEGG
ncbi:MAG: glycosyltransferase family 1 protein [Planctomycetota bacterium]